MIPDLSKIKHVVTHNGVFHADEVFAIAFLNIVAKRTVLNLFHVIRVNNDDIDQYKDRDDVIIVDIGGGEFDHHKLYPLNNTCKSYRSYARNINGVKEYKRYDFASFGKVVRAYHELVDPIKDLKEYKYFDRNFVCKIDGYDNGDRTYNSDFSNLLNEMNPVWNAEIEWVGDPEDEVSFNFMDAICFCMFIINKKLENIKAMKDAESIIEEAKKNENNHIIILNKYVPYLGKLNPDTEYVIFPSKRDIGCYNISVQKNENGEFIKPLPKEWYGYNRKENSIDNSSQKDPVKGLIFCHHTGFLAVFDSIENAVNAITNL